MAVAGLAVGHSGWSWRCRVLQCDAPPTQSELSTLSADHQCATLLFPGGEELTSVCWYWWWTGLNLGIFLENCLRRNCHYWAAGVPVVQRRNGRACSHAQPTSSAAKASDVGFLIKISLIPLYVIVTSRRELCRAPDFRDNTGSLCAAKIDCDSFLWLQTDMEEGLELPDSPDSVGSLHGDLCFCSEHLRPSVPEAPKHILGLRLRSLLSRKCPRAL